MKCDKLKAEPMIINDDYTALYYPKDSVDAAIDELKREHHRERHEYIDMVAQHKAKLVEQESENRMLKKKMDDYHLMSDIRRAKIKELKRALWMARAMRAKDCAYKILRDSGIMFAIGDCRGWDKLNTLQKKWQVVANKCRAKAKEYK